jgi:hypothetical protein
MKNSLASGKEHMEVGLACQGKRHHTIWLFWVMPLRGVLWMMVESGRAGISFSGEEVIVAKITI